MSPRFALLSPSGWGNLGDAAIIQALLHAIRRRVPGAEIIGLTLNPEDSEARHGIPTFTCSGLSLDGYGVREPGDRPTGTGGAGGASPPASALRSRVRALIAAVPGGTRSWRLARLVRSELGHRRRLSRRLTPLDAVVVAGGGQLDEYWGGPFGHPYVLWRWAQFAHRRRARYLVLSVGTGTVASRLGKWFVARALALAEYRSYRDAGSRALLGNGALTRDDPVVPDLAFSLPVAAGPRDPGGGRVLAVSPIAYRDPRVWPDPDPARYQEHVRSMIALVERALRDGWEVVLFASDTADRWPIREILAALEPRLSPQQRTRLSAPPIESVDDLMTVLVRSDVVVAARLHGVVLAHVAGRPVLALSYDRKVSTQMADVGHSDYCLDIDGLAPEEIAHRLDRLWQVKEEAGAQIAARVAAARRRVEDQYDRLFGPPVT